MTVALPQPIAAFFQAKNDHDVDAVIACFTPNATVFDEGENQKATGQDAIRKWMEGTIANYKLSTDVMKCADGDGETVVTALVTGDFPGSPISFDYFFTLKDGKIDALRIN